MSHRKLSQAGSSSPQLSGRKLSRPLLAPDLGALMLTYKEEKHTDQSELKSVADTAAGQSSPMDLESNVSSDEVSKGFDDLTIIETDDKESLTGDDKESPTGATDRSPPANDKRIEKMAAQETFLNQRSNSFVDGDEYSHRVGKYSPNQKGEYAKLNERHAKTDRLNEIKDPACDPDNPRAIQFQDVSSAMYKIRGGILRTPCTRSCQLSTLLGLELYFKKEFLQTTGSFKERGARYTLLELNEDQKEKGVIAASAGNHALALSYHGKLLGVPVTVVMPVVAPLMKISLCRTYGANVIVKGDHIGESKNIAMEIGHNEGLLYINGYDHPDILAGQGTMGLEILEQVPDLDAVVVPSGGAGLIAGVALALKYLYPDILVIATEAENCASFTNALAAGKPVYTKPGSTLADGINVLTPGADGLSVPIVGVNAFATARPLVDKVVTVSEEHIARAILKLVEVEKAIVEGAGAVGLAALMAGALPELKGKKVVVPLCGGNIDTTVLGRCLERGLAAEGRMVRLLVTVSDRPGGIAELTTLLASLGASIKDIFHERAWLKTDIFSVRVKAVVETRDWEHVRHVENTLRRHYTDVFFDQHTEQLR